MWVWLSICQTSVHESSAEALQISIFLVTDLVQGILDIEALIKYQCQYIYLT